MRLHHVHLPRSCPAPQRCGCSATIDGYPVLAGLSGATASAAAGLAGGQPQAACCHTVRGKASCQAWKTGARPRSCGAAYSVRVYWLLADRPRFGLELVRDLSKADGLLTSEGIVYPLLNRLRDNGLVTSRWIHQDAAHPRRYFSITDRGNEHLAAFRAEWSAFAAAVDSVLRPGPSQAPQRHRASRPHGR